jgi:hypothetical protein
MQLQNVVEALSRRTNYPCSFRDKLPGDFDPIAMLIFERLLQVIADLRRILTQSTPTTEMVVPADYNAARTLLRLLPLAPADRTISSQALATAQRLFVAARSAQHQLVVPDRSADGHSWFTRIDAVKWADFSYTTAKKLLSELEDEGILESTIAQNNRERGRVIHYRFADGRHSPFGWRNPFELLPKIEDSG